MCTGKRSATCSREVVERRGGESSARRPRHEPRQLLEVVVVDGGATAEATKLKVELALLPRVVIAAMQTTTIRASITAYSTAVGPSSFLRNSTIRLLIVRSMCYSRCEGWSPRQQRRAAR